MSRKRLPPDDPREWLNRARSNLARARNIAPGIYLEDLCFNAQQAAEKAIKAVFIGRRERFPYVHELDQLLQLLEQNGLKIPKYVREADELSRFAVESLIRGYLGQSIRGNTATRSASRKASCAGLRGRSNFRDAQGL